MKLGPWYEFHQSWYEYRPMRKVGFWKWLWYNSDWKGDSNWGGCEHFILKRRFGRETITLYIHWNRG